MHLYGKPQGARPGDANAEPGSVHGEQHTSSPGPATRISVPLTVPVPPTSSTPLSAVQIPKSRPSEPGSKARRSSHTVNIPFPPLFQPNASSTSLASSTAEGKPIPLDDTTAAHRTSALQKLNSTYPSEVRRHRYAKSAGAQSTTYSQPVLVRTYTGLPPSQTSHGGRGPRYRPSSSSRGGSRRVPLPVSLRQSTATLSGKPIQPALSGVGNSNSSFGQQAGEGGSQAAGQGMSRHKTTKSTGSLPLPLPLPVSLPWQWTSTPRRSDQDETKLPPLEAFSFKSIMADVQSRNGDGGIGADLDRIAEICARSRYSLSNQYEVHVTPHGSGQSFLISSSIPTQRRKHGGPTLQAFNSDDDDGVTRSHRKRRSGGRRKSVAYGTLETIMSSSRSSEEDQSKKKPAAEIASEVRGRASRKNWDSSTGSGSKSGSAEMEVGSHGRVIQRGPGEQGSKKTLARKKSASFATAIIDSGRGVGKQEVASALVGEPALPQTSNTNLGVRTASGLDSGNNSLHDSRAPSPEQQIEVHLADNPPHQEEAKGSTHDGWSSWIPWRQQPQRLPDSSPNRDSASHAEGSLRQLLKSVDVHSDKGKTVDREGYTGGD